MTIINSASQIHKCFKAKQEFLKMVRRLRTKSANYLLTEKELRVIKNKGRP